MSTKIAKKPTLFCVSLGAQEKLVDKYCFGKCRKILSAGLVIAGGAFFVCREEKCPHEEKRAFLGEEIVAGKQEQVFARKLARRK